MNRRSFFKTITGFAAGVFAAFVPGKAKANCSPIISTCKGFQPNEDTINDWTNAFNEFEEPIAGIEEMQGKVVVVCEHSVFEMYVDCDGGIRRKLLCYI